MVTNVINEGLSSPTCSILIILTLYVYVKILYGELESKHWISSYKDIINRGQWYRIITSIIIHVSFPHMLLTIFTLWQLRRIEIILTPLFFFRYSILLIYCESFLSNVTAYILLTGKIIVLGEIGTSLGMRLANLNVFGTSALALSWLSYASTNSIMYTNSIDSFYIWGLIPIPWFLAPLITVLSYQMLAPPNHSLSNLSGLLSGYLLSSGIIAVLSNSYWSICILFDIFLITVIKSFFSESNVNSSITNNINNNGLQVIRPSNENLDNDIDDNDNDNTNNI